MFKNMIIHRVADSWKSDLQMPDDETAARRRNALSAGLLPAASSTARW